MGSTDTPAPHTAEPAAAPTEPVAEPAGAPDQPPPRPPIVLRRLGFADPLRWIALGWRDFLRCPAIGLFYGGCFMVMGWALLKVYEAAPAYVMALSAGFLLMGPFLCLGPAAQPAGAVRAGGVRDAGAAEPLVAVQVPLRSAGMGLALDHLRQASCDAVAND